MISVRSSGIECYAPTDNVSELTARTNDEGWATIFVEWLKISKLLHKDAVFHFFGRWRQSRKEHQPNLVMALPACKDRRRPRSWASLGVTAAILPRSPTRADRANREPENVTPHSEAFQAVVCICWSRTRS